ncbi:MAG: phytanoyl-CoA dioxygenase family protein [Chloroflexota bacterium]
MQLTHAQKLEFYEKGYVRLPGVIPDVMVDAAVKAINHSFGEGIDPAKIITYRLQTFCPELRNASVITDLYNQTPVKALAESMIGAGKISPVNSGQIAVRFPTMDDPPTFHPPHVDGRHAPNNGVPAGKLHSFTMLVGIALSDVQCEYAGNLAVWPHTHRLFEQYFQEHGTADFRYNPSADMPPVDMPEPVQMIVRAGDAIFAHYQVAHTVAPNVSPHPRYAIYFRLCHVDHVVHGPEVLTDIWLEWDGMRAIVA